MTTHAIAEKTADAAPNARLSGPPHSAARRPDPADRHGGYTMLSIALHWLSVLFSAGLILTAWLSQSGPHGVIGLVASPFLLAHALRRLARGFPRAPDEPAILSLIARLAIIAMLLAMVVIVLSGLAVVLASDRIALLFGSGVVLPWPPSPGLTAMSQSMHSAAVQGFLAAAAIHVLAALGYGARRMHAVTIRIVRPVRGGL